MLWTGTGHTFSRYRDGVWKEFTPLDAHIEPGSSGVSRSCASDLVIGTDDTLWALSGGHLVRREGKDWSVTPLSELTRGAQLASRHVAVDDEGAVLLLVQGLPQAVDEDADVQYLIRFDGTTTTELAQLPGGAGYRIADVGAGGAVWLVGGSSEGRYFDRIHVVAPTADVLVEQLGSA